MIYNDNGWLVTSHKEHRLGEVKDIPLKADQQRS